MRVRRRVLLALLLGGCGSGADAPPLRPVAIELDVSPTAVAGRLRWVAALGACAGLPAGAQATFDGQLLTASSTAASCEAELTLQQPFDFVIRRPVSTFVLSLGGSEWRAGFQALIGPHGLSGPLGSPPLTPGSEIELQVEPATDRWTATAKLGWREYAAGPNESLSPLTGTFKVTIPSEAVPGQTLTFSAGAGTGSINAGVAACDFPGGCAARPMIIPGGVTITVRSGG